MADVCVGLVDIWGLLNFYSSARLHLSKRLSVHQGEKPHKLPIFPAYDLGIYPGHSWPCNERTCYWICTSLTLESALSCVCGFYSV